MYFDRLDIIEAHYLYLSENHEGQWSEKYAKLCKILKYFSPSPFLKYESLSENGQAIYMNLNNRGE